MKYWIVSLIFGSKGKLLVFVKPCSHCANVATVHPNAGQPVYRDEQGHIS